MPVRTFDGNPAALSGGTALLYDYEAPFGLPVSYSSLESPGTSSAQVTVNESQVWLIHPGVPALSVPIELSADSFQEEEWGVAQGVHWPMGRKRPVVQTDGARKDPATSLTVSVATLTELEDLRTLLADAGTLLLNVPAGLQYGVSTSYVAVETVRNRRPSDIGADQHRNVALPYQVVDRPVGGSQAERTWVDVIADNATWADVMAKYPTWLDLLAGP